MSVIVKVQIPVSSMPEQNNVWERIMIYDKPRSHLEFVDDKELYERLGGELKMFFHAEWSVDGWVIGEAAPWQDW